MQAELVENMGSDLTVVNAARVSMNKESFVFTYRKDKPKGSDEGLIKYLAKNNHWTPFSHARETFIIRSAAFIKDISFEQGAAMQCKLENGYLKIRHSLWGWAQLCNDKVFSPQAVAAISYKLSDLYPECWKLLIHPHETPQYPMAYHVPTEEEEDPNYIDVTMREKVPIFVARQRFKHMVGFTYNEVSRRYVDDAPEFFTPDVWRSKPEGSIKQGSGEKKVSRIKYTQRDGYGGVLSFKPETKEVYEYLILHCEQVYSAMLRSGVAPEQARMVLPQSMYTEYYVTGSLSAWARAYKQRIDAHAQVEIQDLAKQWGDIIAPLYPASWEALTQ